MVRDEHQPLLLAVMVGSNTVDLAILYACLIIIEMQEQTEKTLGSLYTNVYSVVKIKRIISAHPFYRAYSEQIGNRIIELRKLNLLLAADGRSHIMLSTEFLLLFPETTKLILDKARLMQNHEVEPCA